MSHVTTNTPSARLARAATLALVGAGLAIASVGCASSQPTAARKPAEPAAPLAADRSATAQGTGALSMAKPDGMIRGSIAYPTGDPKTSALILEKAVPAEVMTNKPYVYELTVRNVSTGRLENVVVHETMPAGLKLGEVTGATVAIAGDKVRFTVGSLEAGKSATISVPATATQTGAATNNVSVSYDSSLAMNIQVVQPALAMTTSLPAEAMRGGTVPLKITVTNSGTGVARNVKLEDVMPDGMATLDGKPGFSVPLGDIAAGEVKNVELPVKLSRHGAYTNTATATGDDGLRAEATAQVTARQPILEVEKTGPKQQYVGVPYTYEIAITHKGDADARAVRVSDMLPAGLAVADASDNGQLVDGKVFWRFANIAKGATQTIKLTVKGTEPGTAYNTVDVQAEFAQGVNVSGETLLVGVPAVRMEILDEADPVVVGAETAYTISVTNQGSAPATNIRLMGELENQMEYVSSKGATAGKMSDGKVAFEPLATLAPKQTATYRVVVKATGNADARFKASMTSDQLGRPVDQVESTTFYR